MVKERYFYYLFLICALINIINFVPRILIDHRFSGALVSILISVVIGSILLVCLVKIISHFPKEGLPEIFRAAFPKVFATILLIMLALLWYEFGSITLVSFVDITIRFINPEVHDLAVIGAFLILVLPSCRLRSESILFALEAILVINTPIALFMLIKALISPYFSWDAVYEIFTHLWSAPDYTTIAAGNFIFSGYTNLVIFNRVFVTMKPRYLWTIPISGLLILMVTFLVPIGIHGTIGVNDHVYTWFSTADALRVDFFVVERILYLFYFTYLTLTLVSIIISWHVALGLVKGAFGKINPSQQKYSSVDWWIVSPMALGTISMLWVDQQQLEMFGKWFLNIRLIGEIALVSFLFIAYFRRKNRA